MENHRPISLLAFISKIFEIVVFNQIYQYFVENNLLFDGQYGFKKHHSTELAALELVDRISNGLDKKKPLFPSSSTYPRRSTRWIIKYFWINFSIME